MARFESNLTTYEIAGIFQWLGDGKTVREIHQLLAQSGHGLSERQIYNYKHEFDTNEAARVKDNPVVWEHIDALIKSGVAREHLSPLRSVAAWTTSTFGPSKIFGTHPSYRTLRWQSYVLSYAASVELPLDTWVLGELFVHREILADYMKKPIEKADIDGLLSFKPWEGKAEELQYLTAIKQGLVPKSSTSHTDGTYIKTQFFKTSIALVLSNLIDGREYLLPSQQLSEFKKQGKSIPVISVHIDGQDKPEQIRLRF